MRNKIEILIPRLFYVFGVLLSFQLCFAAEDTKPILITKDNFLKLKNVELNQMKIGGLSITLEITEFSKNKIIELLENKDKQNQGIVGYWDDYQAAWAFLYKYETSPYAFIPFMAKRN